ncbi:hypothetical protein [Yoonia sp.]|uniref:hypothetical protein n=1 Tax=Yoonia sp. TaxID=2212373 RepID=UPI0039771568
MGFSLEDLMATVKIDGVEHDFDSMSKHAQDTVRSLQFVEERLQQRRNELAVADTARGAYMRALKSTLDAQKAEN